MTGPQASPELHAALLCGSAAEQEIQNITDEAERLMAGGESRTGPAALMLQDNHIKQQPELENTDHLILF